MKKEYVLDACAMIAYIADEDGAGIVQKILSAAGRGRCRVFMHAINLLEVYYGVVGKYGESAAGEMLESIKLEPITVCHETSEDMIIDAGRFKSRYKISIADSIGLAQAVKLKASFVTSDHHELDAVDVAENIDFTWIRPVPPSKKRKVN